MADLDLEFGKSPRQSLEYGTIKSRIYSRTDRSGRVYIEIWIVGGSRRWRRALKLTRDRAKYEWLKLAQFQALAVSEFSRRLNDKDFRNTYGMKIDCHDRQNSDT